MLERTYNWLDERMGLVFLWRALFLRKIPRGVNWLYTLGFATLFVFIIQAATGTFLSMYYSATPDHAYDSINYIMSEVAFGRVVRGLHHWGANAMVVLVILHLLTVFILGAYKHPRELTWVIGVLLFLATMGAGFTGYLLPWDEKAYWATVIGTNMSGTVPYMGEFIFRFLRGGSEVGAVTLTRFYSFHVFIIPASLALLMGLHLYLVIRQGVSVLPWLWEKRETSSHGVSSHE